MHGTTHRITQWLVLRRRQLDFYRCTLGMNTKKKRELHVGGPILAALHNVCFSNTYGKLSSDCGECGVRPESYRLMFKRLLMRGILFRSAVIGRGTALPIWPSQRSCNIVQKFDDCAFQPK